jgi:hypothetical protein
LPFKISRGKRLVWCLQLAEDPFLYLSRHAIGA